MARPSMTVPGLCRLTLSGLLLGAVALSPLVGCESTASRRHKQIRRNLTPELDTLWQRDVDQENAVALSFDENGRMFNQDWGRFWMTDRPSRLTPEPVPH